MSNIWKGLASGAAEGAGAGTTILPGWGTLAGTVIGAGAGMIGASMQSDEEKKAAARQAAMEQAKMDWQKRMDLSGLAQANRSQGLQGLNYMQSNLDQAMKMFRHGKSRDAALSALGVV